MVVLRARVMCAVCEQPVDRVQTLLQQNSGSGRVHECFDCFRKKKGKGKQTQTKLSLYCERCKYKFSSNKNTCPYCGRGDLVVASEVSLGDLL